MRWKLTRQAMHDWIAESALNPDKTTNNMNYHLRQIKMRKTGTFPKVDEMHRNQNFSISFVVLVSCNVIPVKAPFSSS